MKQNSLVFLLLFIPFLLLSQDDSEDIQIGEANIVSLQLPLQVEDTGRSVTVFTADDIKKAPANSFAELIRFLPGVSTNSRGGFGVQDDLSMRGSTFSQVLIVIDGVRWNDPLTAHFNTAFPIPLSEIQQIEIVRGAASAIYGADAVGGLIHIQTKTANSTQQTGFASSGNAYYGENKLSDADFSARYGFGKLNLSAAYKKTTSDGEQLNNPNYSAGVSEKEQYNTFFDIEDYTFGANYKANKNWEVNARYAKDKRDFDAKYFYTASAYDESYEENSFELGQIGVTNNNNAGTTKVDVVHRVGTDFFEFNPLFAANDHKTKRLSAIASHQFNIKNDQQFIVGVQHDNVNVESTDRGNHDQQTTEAYATYFKDWNDLSLVASLRGGDNSDYGFQLSPQASVSYQQQNYLLRASAGRAVRSADFTERYVSYNLPEVAPGRNIGNPSLSVEESFTFDAGADVNLTNNLRYSVTAYTRNSSNLIDYVAVNSNTISEYDNLVENETYFQANNIGKANTYGLEQELNWSNQWQNSGLQVQASHNYIYTKLSEEVVSKYLAHHPRHQLNLNLNGTIGRVNVGMNNSYIHRNADAVEAINGEIQSDYFLSNLKAGVQVHDNYAISARMHNVFNNKYQEILGAPMPSRWFSAGLQWNIN